MKYINFKKRINSKGITLIALVITIVVLLILATVSIQIINGENGLFNRTENAVISNKEAQKEEKIKLAVAAAQLEGKGTITTENLNKELKANFNDDSIIAEQIDTNWYVDEYFIDENGNVEKYTKLLPKEYKKVEYIESRGEQFFVLDKLSTKDFGFDIDLSISNGTGANVFGGYKDNENTFCYMGTRNYQLSYFPNDQSFVFSHIDYGNQHNYKYIKTNALQSNYYYDGNLIGTSSLQNNVDCALAVFTFIDNDGIPRTSSLETFRGKIYKFILYDGDTEICNLVPCIRITDNKIGMYDIVAGKFYTNESGVGEFIAGPNV